MVAVRGVCFGRCGMGSKSRRLSVLIYLVFPMLSGLSKLEATVSSVHMGVTENQPNILSEIYDSYIILSFVNGTLVLSIGENIEEVQDTGFLSAAPTLAVQQIGADALLQ